MVSHSLHGAVKMSPHLTDSFIWGVYLRMSSENLSSFQDLLLLHRGFFYERPTRERKRAREREKDRERRDRERGRERKREKEKTQKGYYLHNMRSAYFSINRRLHGEREREQEIERQNKRERDSKTEQEK